ncbi:MAG: hypothetical protein M4579_006366 [Chaenotheca gracillima]|nr:MAG: hypothetical protein M4579_006366 [Chaenotheca gracillima]
MSSGKKDVQASLGNLSISGTEPTPGKKLPTKSASGPKVDRAVVAESWEDELGLSGDEEPGKGPSGLESISEIPGAPPPTPVSPTAASSSSSSARASAAPSRRPTQSEDLSSPWTSDALYGIDDSTRKKVTTARPEKTDAVAKRLIAGALGVRAPKKTDEQREYDKAVREKEMKRRTKEKEDQRKAELDVEKARTAVWED